jgi:hypothetical protein
LTRTGWKEGGFRDGELSDDDEEEESGDEGDSEEQEEEKEPFREGLESWG